MTRPDGKAETLGLQILDEPAAKQSDPTGMIILGSGNSRVTKPSYKTELRVVTSYFELVTRVFYFYYNIRVTNSRFLFQLKYSS